HGDDFVFRRRSPDLGLPVKQYLFHDADVHLAHHAAEGRLIRSAVIMGPRPAIDSDSPALTLGETGRELGQVLLPPWRPGDMGCHADAEQGVNRIQTAFSVVVGHLSLQALPEADQLVRNQLAPRKGVSLDHRKRWLEL